MEPLHTNLEIKMDVYGSDEEFLGEIKELRDIDFLVDRTMQRDLYVPYTAIQSVYPDSVILSTPVDQVDQMGWLTTATSQKDEAQA